MDIRNNPRVIILKGKNIDQAQSKLQKFRDELQERDVVIEVRPSSRKFEIELIGKDGGKKWEDDENFEVQDILNKIDSMPMRKEEMYGQEKKQQEEIKQ